MAIERVVYLGQYFPLKTSFSQQKYIDGLLHGRHYSRHQGDDCEYKKPLDYGTSNHNHRVQLKPQQESDKEEGVGDQKRGTSDQSCEKRQHCLNGNPKEMVAKCLHRSLASNYFVVCSK